MQTRHFQLTFLSVTPSELEITTLHAFQVHEAAQEDGHQPSTFRLPLQKRVAIILRLNTASLLSRTAVKLYVLKSPSKPDNLSLYYSRGGSADGIPATQKTDPCLY